MLIDLHCHSVYSLDNHLEPEVLIEAAIRRGLDGVCFTEHYSVEASWPLDRMPLPENFLVLRGAEVSTDCGHVLVYGVSDDTWNRWGRNMYLNLAEVIESVHSLGGICVPAHPFRGWESLGEKIYQYEGFDGVETHNGVDGPMQVKAAMMAATRMGLPSVGGSDCHYAHQVGRACTEFQDPINCMSEVVAAIKAGRCRGRMLRKGPE